MKYKYIKGHRINGEQLIALLEKHGGKNIWDLDGGDEHYLYYIDEDSCIGCIPWGTYDYIQLLKNGELLNMPTVVLEEAPQVYWFVIPEAYYEFELLYEKFKELIGFKENIRGEVGDVVHGKKGYKPSVLRKENRQLSEWILNTYATQLKLK